VYWGTPGAIKTAGKQTKETSKELDTNTTLTNSRKTTSTKTLTIQKGKHNQDAYDLDWKKKEMQIGKRPATMTQTVAI
jgi:hypothetical protein